MSDPAHFDPIISELEKDGPIKLDIGSGGPVFERRDMTWKTVDKFASADITADMWDLPFEDGTVDAIWCSHALEHVDIVKVIPTLKEWFRVLKSGGICNVMVPDFDYIAQHWIEYGPRGGALGMIYGNQVHEGEYHKVAFNEDSLVEDFKEVGFDVLESKTLWTEEYTMYSAWVIGKKP